MRQCPLSVFDSALFHLLDPVHQCLLQVRAAPVPPPRVRLSAGLTSPLVLQGREVDAQVEHSPWWCVRDDNIDVRRDVIPMPAQRAAVADGEGPGQRRQPPPGPGRPVDLDALQCDSRVLQVVTPGEQTLVDTLSLLRKVQIVVAANEHGVLVRHFGEEGVHPVDLYLEMVLLAEQFGEGVATEVSRVHQDIARWDIGDEVVVPVVRVRDVDDTNPACTGVADGADCGDRPSTRRGFWIRRRLHSVRSVGNKRRLVFLNGFMVLMSNKVVYY